MSDLSDLFFFARRRGGSSAKISYAGWLGAKVIP